MSKGGPGVEGNKPGTQGGARQAPLFFLLHKNTRSFIMHCFSPTLCICTNILNQTWKSIDNKRSFLRVTVMGPPSGCTRLNSGRYVLHSWKLPSHFQKQLHVEHVAVIPLTSYSGMDHRGQTNCPESGTAGEPPKIEEGCSRPLSHKVTELYRASKVIYLFH